MDAQTINQVTELTFALLEGKEVVKDSDKAAYVLPEYLHAMLNQESDDPESVPTRFVFHDIPVSSKVAAILEKEGMKPYSGRRFPPLSQFASYANF